MPRPELGARRYDGSAARRSRVWRARERPRRAVSARASTDRFREPITVELASGADADAAIRFTVRSGTASRESGTYDGRSSSARARGCASSPSTPGRTAPWSNPTCTASPTTGRVELLEAAPRAAVHGGRDRWRLIDGLRSDDNWRIGGWHGFRHTDFTATIDLQAPRARDPPGRRRAFCRIRTAWIWMPARNRRLGLRRRRGLSRDRPTVATDVEPRRHRVSSLRDLDGRPGAGRACALRSHPRRGTSVRSPSGILGSRRSRRGSSSMS